MLNGETYYEGTQVSGLGPLGVEGGLSEDGI